MEQVKFIKEREKCSACGACMTVCPKKAISMCEDEYGCLYPVICMEQCVHCGLCERICPYGEMSQQESSPECYAAVGVCDSLVRTSASGGVFAVLAMDTIQRGGLVAGAVMDCDEEGMRVYHMLSDRQEDIKRMQGSKYVQSEAWLCYPDICAALKEGKKVLFSGTPCQVDAVKHLTGNPGQLTTIDLICHGTPPQRMLNDYAKIINQRFGGILSEFLFRDKTCGKSFCASVVFRRGTKERRYYAKARFFSFYQHFLNGDIYRENCYTCPYARIERVSDITLGDYWGINEAHANEIKNGQMVQRNDWSCVLVHTEKGKRLIERCSKKLEIHPTRLEWIAKTNRQLLAPCIKTAARKKVLEHYQNGGYEAVEREFIRTSGGKIRYYKRLIVELMDNRKKSKGKNP